MKDKASVLEPNVIEVYSDGACSPNPGTGGIGVVIRYLDPVGEPFSSSDGILMIGPIIDDPSKMEEMQIEISRGYRQTTNNRMEMLAALEGLKEVYDILKLRTSHHLRYKKQIGAVTVKIISDSSYLCNGFSKGWVNKWKRSNWVTSTGGPVKNIDIWQDLISTLEDMRRSFGARYQFVHVPGHRGYIFNERCDKLAVKARQSSNLLVDQVYENSMKRR